MDITKVCRVCANQIRNQSRQRNIFKYMRGKLNDQLKLITGVELTATEGLPEFLCDRCTSELDLAVKFRERCIFSQKYLLDIKTKTQDLHPSKIASPELHEQLIDAEEFVTCNEEDEVESHTDEDPEALVMAAAEQAEIQEKRQERASKRSKNFFICNECGRIFNDECQYNDHLEGHLGRREMRHFFPCPECPQIFKRKFTLKEHRTRNHLGHRQFVCSTCNEVFIALGDKLRHEKAHQNERPYPCLECGMCFSSVVELQAHSSTHPEDKWKFRCEPCNENFQSRKDVQTHSKTANHKLMTKHMQDEITKLFDS
ncbi:transcription factor Ouib [Drosophila kikkawai]|uniref:Transcription factor Ouib n=1 Tax=Drosophila kikkawai TaxID=30033 RepID=A0A6P4I392_DROKI|nr:transcription factor Ouib [Drosophila kikkawai]